MTEESGSGALDRTFLLEPPAAGEVTIHVEVGSEVELSAEARAALEHLLGLLHDAEVSGFAAYSCGSLSDCWLYKCRLDDCKPLVSRPCFADVSCTVTKFV
jgi:hypothetical protein